MSTVLLRIWGWIILLFADSQQRLEPPTPEPELPPAPLPVIPKPKAQAPNDAELYGQFYFKTAILDQLDLYFHYIKRMKMKDRQGYDLYKQVGAQVVPRRTVLSVANAKARPYTDDDYRVSSWFINTKPAFGAVSYGLYKEAEKEGRTLLVDEGGNKSAEETFGQLPSLLMLSGVPHKDVGVPKKMVSEKTNYRVGIIWAPKFVYFTKYSKAPPGLEQHSTGTIYKLTIYWDRKDNNDLKWSKKNKGGIPQEYALWIMPSGEIRVLRMHEKMVHQMRSKKERTWTLARKEWTYPCKYLRWCEGFENETPLQMLVRIFAETTRLFEQAAMGSMIRIEATRDQISAVFGVDVKRTAYFFKDREAVVDPVTGKKKRIFHIVRPHERVSGAAVPLHFRGLRQFTWNGCQIYITVPGRDHQFLTEFDLGAVSEDDPDLKGEATIPQTAFGGMWRAHIHGVPLRKSIDALLSKFEPKGRAAKQHKAEDRKAWNGNA